MTEDYHPPDPDYWEEIMPQFDLDDTAVEADLIVEEVSCNMIELESENYNVMTSPVWRTMLLNDVLPHCVVLPYTLCS